VTYARDDRRDELATVVDSYERGDGSTIAAPTPDEIEDLLA